MESGIKRAISVLGSTGSIGQSTLDVVRQHSSLFSVHSLVANSSVDQMLADCLEFAPKYARLEDPRSCDELRDKLKGLSDTEVLFDANSAEMLAASNDVDMVMAAIVGAAGLLPTLSAVKAGKRVLLANKEALVTAGALFMDAAKQSGATILPIDSEHNAIYQCLPDQYACGEDLCSSVEKVLLTASGGPFRGWSKAELERVTPEQACCHPNWSMGRKISVDSASLMNKGLELIEACWLFNIDPSRVEVHIHPESVIHSMVSYSDGSVIAQLGAPDMRTPIAYGMAWPKRINSGVKPLDLFEVASLNFERPNVDLFPCLALAQDAFVEGRAAPAILNAANEVAVEAFLKGNIGFLQIPDTIRFSLENVHCSALASINDVLEVDKQARQTAKRYVERLC